MTVKATPKINITNTDNREIDNLEIKVKFYIDSALRRAVVQHRTFNNIATYGLNALNGRWTGSF